MFIYLCPSDKKYQCSWEGQAEDILDHFQKEHDDLVHYSQQFDINLGINNENRLFMIDEEIYLIQVSIEDSSLILKLRYLGPEKFAKKINYNIAITINNETCPNEIVKTTPEGFLSVDLSRLKQCHPEMESVSCILNITKTFTDEGFSKEEQLAVPHSQKDEEPEVNIINSEEKQQEYALPSKDNENEIKNNDINESSGESDSVFVTTPDPDTSYESPCKVYEIRESREPSNLGRSHSTAFEIKRKKWSRSSTMSLRYPIETNNDRFCSNCQKPLRIPVYICPEYHRFCEMCQPGFCNLCHHKISDVRDDESERIFNKFTLMKCKFQKYGCPEKLFSEELHQHEVNCPFCVYRCPIDECLYEGHYKALCQHLKAVHSSRKVLSNFILAFNTYPEAFLADEDKGIFFCYVKYGTEKVEWTAKFCGPKERVFFCEIKFKDGKIKEPILLQRNENVYSVCKSISELKKMKVKVKHAVLTITS